MELYFNMNILTAVPYSIRVNVHDLLYDFPSVTNQFRINKKNANRSAAHISVGVPIRS